MSFLSSVFKGVGKAVSSVTDFLGGNPWIGNVISGVSNIAQGIFNQNNANAINQQNLAMQDYYSKNGIQIRVDDAKKAGIHPLYAIGAQTYTPNYFATFEPSNSISAFGNAVGSAIGNMPSKEQQVYNQVVQGQTVSKNNLELERMQLENALLQRQLQESSGVSKSVANPQSDALIPLFGGQSVSGVQNVKSLPQLKLSADRSDVGFNPSIMKKLANRYNFNTLENGFWNGSPYFVTSISPAQDYSDIASENVFDKLTDFGVRHNPFSLSPELKNLTSRIQSEYGVKLYPFYENGEWKLTNNFARTRVKSYYGNFKDSLQETPYKLKRLLKRYYDATDPDFIK